MNLFKFIPKNVKDYFNNTQFAKSLKILEKDPFNMELIKKTLFSTYFYLITKPNLRWIDKHIKGHLYFSEIKILYKIIKKLPDYSVIVEIGSYLGRSTCVIAEAIKKKNIKFYTIDTFENQDMSEGLRDTYREFCNNILPYKDKIVVKRGFSYNVVKEFQNVKIDLLWIDGDHKYKACKKDIVDWLPLVSKYRRIIFHDYYEHQGNVRVKKAVDEKFKEKKIKKVQLIGRIMITKKV